MSKLRQWKQLPKELLLHAFKKANFAGVDQMEANDRLFQRIAPIGVNDIMMAVQYQYKKREPLDIPIVSFDGLRDGTIARGNVAQWLGYTKKGYRNMEVDGDHYLVSSQYRQVVDVIAGELLDLIEGKHAATEQGGHEWIQDM